MAFIVTCFAWQVNAQTYNGDNTGAVIDGSADVLSAANIPLVGNVGADIVIDNVTIDITHVWDGDLDIYLESPLGKFGLVFRQWW